MSSISLETLEKRLAREQAARAAAENLLESKSTELFELNQELESAARRLTSKTMQLDVILDNTIAAIFLVDHEGMIKKANAAATILFGYELEQITQMRIYELLPASATDIHKTGVIDEEEVECHRSDGAVFPCEIAAAAASLYERPHTVWFCRDVTRRKIEEGKRNDLQQELLKSRKLESLGTLSSGIAHEMNTPLQYVSDNVTFLKDAFSDLKTYMEFLQDKCGGGEDVDEKRRELDIDYLMEDAPSAFEQSAEGLSRVGEIIKAVKEFAHPGGSDFAQADVNKTIASTVTIAKNEWKYVAEVTLDLDPELPTVVCNIGEINQVILNLIVNAAHAIEDAKKDEGGQIRVATRSFGDQIEITVCDNGCGVPDGAADKIFDPFFTTKEVGKGSGQGLAIAYNIVKKKHGGEISVESKAGAGSQFRILLPVKLSEDVKEAV